MKGPLKVPRQSSTQITKQHANALVGKLGATVKQKKHRAHDLAVVYVEGVRVGQFGIRRGSRNTAGHDFIPKNLHITTGQCRLLAECNLTYEAWVQILRDKNILPTKPKK